MRVERRVDFDAGIDERRLCNVAPGRSGIVGRARQQRRLCHATDIGDRLPERGADIANIAAKCDHGVSHQAFRLRIRTTPTSSKIAAIGACGLWTVTFTALTFGKAPSTASATAPAARSSNL